ncbi:hypothetical protein BD779DRAFT_155503 [Infundibulicybe gibba]|nr:hypothetical protein BD779DRAFT_155503 [Infundibulicybe gibba]
MPAGLNLDSEIGDFGSATLAHYLTQECPLSTFPHLNPHHHLHNQSPILPNPHFHILAMHLHFATKYNNSTVVSTLQIPSSCPIHRQGSARSLKRVLTITKTQGQAIIERRGDSRSSSPSDCRSNASVGSLRRVRTITKAMGQVILRRRSNSRSPSPSDCGSSASSRSLERVRTITKVRGQAIVQRRNRAHCGALQMI